MRTAIIGLLAETSLHPGTGQVAGTVDLPVAREAATGYPVIPGSGLKGALRDRAEQKWGKKAAQVEDIFGEQNRAGAVAVTDARLLLLPVRSLNGHYKWVTCPYLLERYARDRELVGMPVGLPELSSLENGRAAVVQGQGQLLLEELSFDLIDGLELASVCEAIKPLIRHASVQERLAGGLVVVNDDEFAYFARYGLAVSARNVLDDDKKTSENLWYEETLPPDSLFYALLLARPGKEGVLADLAQVFSGRPYLQVGGNETVGQGWCVVSWLASSGGE